MKLKFLIGFVSFLLIFNLGFAQPIKSPEKRSEQLKAQQLEFRQELQEKKREREESQNRFLEQLKMKIQDQKRKEILRRIYLRISILNQRLCDHFTALIEHLEKLLQRAQEKIRLAKEQGLNVIEAEEALNLAKEKIDEAKEKIREQTSKVYTFSLEKEEEVKLKIGELYQKFQQDIKVVHEKIKEAFFATREVFQKIAKIKLQREATKEE